MSAVDSDALLSACTIKMIGTRVAAEEPDALVAVMKRVAWHSSQAQNIELYCTPRRPDGWLEWTLRVQYTPEYGITVGCVQRRLGAEVEFHS